MKELSIEQKAKAYEDLIKRLKDFQSEYRFETIDKYFPELKESESENTDEKIRKALIKLVTNHASMDLFIEYDIHLDEALSWLEKQGEQKSTDNLTSQEAMDIAVAKCFEQGEQKHTDKTEPKFKEGDWVFIEEVKGYKNGPFKIKIVDSLFGYSFDEYHIISFMYEDLLSKWTIQDAKDGDVLSNWNNTTFIFKAIEDETVKFHIAYNEKWDEIQTPLTKLSHLGLPEPQFEFHPATKEQRDTLMKAMTDAGYTFDFEKKELKKIVVPIFNIGDTIAKKHNSDIHDFGSFTITDITGGKYWYNDRIICDITEQNEWEIYEPVRQKPAWSEEDEKRRKDVLRLIKEANDKYIKELGHSPFSADILWLKSLKDRVQIQPKQEWSEEDERMYRGLHNLIYSTTYCDSRKELSDFLDSLKNRVQQQSMQEWGEEDKKCTRLSTDIIDSALRAGFCVQIDRDRCVDWFKSLKERCTWKPSDEQMKVLYKVLNFAANHENPHWNDYIFGTLHNLIRQLKKLREK